MERRPASAPTILVVDDEPNIVELARSTCAARASR